MQRRALLTLGLVSSTLLLVAGGTAILLQPGLQAGIAAELLAKAGLKVVIIEEGPLKSSRDFNQKESEAYPSLYQESAARKTEDKAINILQGRCVGGSTTVNWTSSFRTPQSTLQFWQDRFEIEGGRNGKIKTLLCSISLHK